MDKDMKSQSDFIRLDFIDRLRGLLMVLMALDHCIFFVLKHHPMEYWGRPFTEYTSYIAFFTRISAHLCAPGFFFLMGVSTVLFMESRKIKGWNKQSIAKHLIARGLLLIIIQEFIVNIAWYIGSNGDVGILGENGPAGSGGQIWISLDVLYALGLSMIVIALIYKLPTIWILFISIGALLGTQFFTPDASEVNVLFSPILRLLIIPGQTNTLLVSYPFLPWFSLSCLGIIFGRYLHNDSRATILWGLRVGIIGIITFVGLRILGVGDFHETGNSLIGFFQMTKYPPSIVYILFTLSINLILLWGFARFCTKEVKNNELLIVFGRNALFFYITHVFLYALIGIFIQTKVVYGVVYILWLLGLIPLYYACKGYYKFKKSLPSNSFWQYI